MTNAVHVGRVSTPKWCGVGDETLNTCLVSGRRGGLVVERRTPGREVGDSIPTQVAVLCHWARHIYLPKGTSDTRKRWLRPDVIEKLLTWALSKNEMKRKMPCLLMTLCHIIVSVIFGSGFKAWYTSKWGQNNSVVSILY